MEKDNYFERKIADEFAVKEVAFPVGDTEEFRTGIERDRQAWRDSDERDRRYAGAQIKLEEIQAENDRTHKGTLPAEVWGAKAGTLCKDFLEYAGGIAKSPNYYPGSLSFTIGQEMAPELVRSFPFKKYKMRITNPGLRLQGYPIAYSSTQDFSSHPDNYGAIERRSYLGPPTILRPNVMLCSDGLLRMTSGKTLRVIDDSGRVEVPTVGRMVVGENGEYKKITSVDTSAAQTDHYENFTKYKVWFEHRDLEQTLFDLALQVKKIYSGAE